MLVVLTYCYHYLYPCSSSYYHYCFYYFIIVTISYCYYSHQYYCPQYYQCYLILSHFISYCSYYYDFCLCVMCDVYVPSLIFFPFLINDLHFILALLIHVQNLFFCHYRLYHHCHHPNHFIFFNNTSHWRRIQQMNSSSMVYPYPLVTLGKP